MCGEILTRNLDDPRLHRIFQDAVRLLAEPPPPRTPKGTQKQIFAKDILVAISDIQSWTGNFMANVEHRI